MSQNMKCLLAVLVLALFTAGARFRFVRHCPLCQDAVMTEWSITRGVLGYTGDAVVVHKDCLMEYVARGGDGHKLENTFSLED